MDTLRKTLATICAIFFIGTAVMALFLFTFDRKAFTAETYQKAFAREDFYNKLPTVMADAILGASPDQSQFPVVMQGMSREAWEGFFRALLPPDALRTMGDEALNSTFEYINMRTDSVMLNLVPLKASMAGETGVQAVMSLLGTLPDCSLLEIGQMSMDLLSGGQIEFCNPPADLYPMLMPVIQSQMQFAASAIPDQVALISAPPVNDPRQRLQSLRIFMRLSPLLPIFFLFGLTLFAVRSLKDWLVWWGVPLLITGLTAFVMSLIGAPMFGAVFQGILVSQMPDYLPVLLLGSASDLAAAMLQALLTPVMWLGLLFAIIGLIMALAGFFINRRATPLPPSEARTIA